jgi:hypothetical protein
MMSGTAGANTIVKVLGDSSIKEELRLKAAQELAETFENNVNCPGYPNFLDGAMKTFLKVLQEGEPHFFSDFNIQQVINSKIARIQLLILFFVLPDEEAHTRDDPSSPGVGNCSALREKYSRFDVEVAQSR